VREIRTHGSTGRGPETGLRRWLNGHEAGNGGYGQVRAYGVPRRPPTLPTPCSTAPCYASPSFGLMEANLSGHRRRRTTIIAATGRARISDIRPVAARASRGSSVM
jgi:hypothetical protein